MKQVTVNDVRLNLSEIIYEYDGLYEMTMRTPDDQFLKLNLCDDFGLDSLDIEEMFVTQCSFYGVTVNKYNPLTKFAFHDEQTIENFMEMVNYYLNQ